MEIVTRADVDASLVPAEVRARHARLFDPLSGLPGWVLLLDRTRVALARAERLGPLVGVIVFDDVRRLHEAGPYFAEFVRLLGTRVRGDDTVARIDTRTFVVVLNDIADRSIVSRIAQRLISDAHITCRIGIAFDEPSDDAEALLDRALREAVSPGAG